MKKGNKGYIILIISLLLFSFFLFIFSFMVGYYKITASEIFTYIFKGKQYVKPEVSIIISRIRLPRITAAFIIGAGLSIAGTSYQGMFKNPLVSPEILGVSNGASLGAALAITLSFSPFLIQTSAFIFGIGVVTIAYFIGSRTKFNQEISLILSGTMLGALASSLTSLLIYFADPQDTLPTITYWLMGSLSKANQKAVLFSVIPIIIGSIVLYFLRWQLNILTLNDDEAKSLGIEPKRIRFIAVCSATIISAAAVCLGGIIGWIGLMIPHIARGISGNDYRYMLPVSALLGGSFLIIIDNIARSFTVEIPLGVLTSIIGAPFFIVLILRRGR